MLFPIYGAFIDQNWASIHWFISPFTKNRFPKQLIFYYLPMYNQKIFDHDYKTNTGHARDATINYLRMQSFKK